MKIVLLAVYQKQKCLRLALSVDVSHVNYFARQPLKEHLCFGSRLGCERTPIGVRQTLTITDVPYSFHIYVRRDGLCGVVVTDEEYPSRVAYSLLNKTLDQYNDADPGWSSATQDKNDECKFLNENLGLFQDPRASDKLCRIQDSLNGITEIMRNNIEQVLLRGENIEVLMQKSEDLSDSATRFRDTAKGSKCCKS
jgi:synaptobrevin family protein YKT6